MPKKVDQDARRAELLDAVSRVIVRDGLHGATIRALAAETGWSTGTLAHYFADKDDILVSALRLSHERIAARWERKLEGLVGIAALRELVIDNLPLDDDRELETRLAVNYWTRAVTLEHVVSSQWREGPSLFDRLAELARDAQALGEIRGDEPAEDIAERLHGLIDGFSLHALLYPQRLGRDRQLELIEREFGRLSAGTVEASDDQTPEEEEMDHA